jgi:hypothetical protein
MALGRGCALVSKEVFGFVWQPETSDPCELPQSHDWTPTDAEVAEMTACEIFSQLNPDSGLADITGEADPDEYNLRKCITYDLVEFEGDFSRLLESWTRGGKEPEGVRDEEDEPAKRPYVRPKKKDGTPIDTMSKGAVAIKMAAAVAVARLLDRIALAHAYPDNLVPILYGGGGGLYAATSMAVSAGRTIVDDDQGWLGMLFAVWIIFLHLLLAAMLWQRFGPRIACRRRRQVMDVGVQVNVLPNPKDMTVEGMKREAKNMGLRTSGLRAALEDRMNVELLHRSDGQH